MNHGKKICAHLKVVRKQIADANDIPYEITECPHQGPCAGTCPKCESELRYIENQLTLRRAAGKAVSLVGLSLGISSVFAASKEIPFNDKPIQEEPPIQSIKTTTDSLPAMGEVEPEDYVLAGLIQNNNYEPLDSDSVFTIADEMTEFPGGDVALMNYIKQNLRYPALAGEMGFQGRVTLSFIVEKDGSISNIEVLRTPAEELSKEAIRVVQSMPKWKPGKIKGTPVRMKYILPMTFRIE
ncbi:MAG: energy transducer TonB [Bacteroidales bacterium]|nr:energy transducer TonB [Bacteroidales bacterium]